MADAAPAPASAPSDPSSNRGRNPRGGQRGGRGGQRQRNGEDHGESGNRERAPGGNRGRGRARGNRGRGNDQINQSAPPPPPPTNGESTTTLAPGKARMFGAALTTAAKPDGENGERSQEGEDDEVEAEVCFICASPVVHNSVAPCNHRTCHICSLRLRALYKTKACAHCRVCIRPVTDD